MTNVVHCSFGVLTGKMDFSGALDLFVDSLLPDSTSYTCGIRKMFI